jgi:hypothetical protein
MAVAAIHRSVTGYPVVIADEFLARAAGWWMLDQLSVDDFSEHVNAPFRIQVESGDSLELELIEARPIGPPSDREGGRRQAFSLIFRGPTARLLDQRIYEVEHPRLGTLGIFLVPLGSEGDPEGLHYQAIFN